MSKDKHTPGPWCVGAINDCLFIINRQPRPSNDYVVFEGSGFATVDKFQIIAKLDYPSADANARLIAAAPETAAERDRLREVNAELLAALKDAVSALDADASKSPLGERHAKLAQGWFRAMYGDKARAAISKAEVRS